jgi:hypothetical protein
MSSLRDQLLGGQPGIPPFRLTLPAGWKAHSSSEESEQALLSEAKARLLQAHQPAALAALQVQVHESFVAARKQGAFLTIMPGADAPDALMAPVSVIASLMSSTAEAPLDSQISRAIEERGARPLDGSRAFLRWVDRRTVQLGGDAVGADTIVYITPIPGTRRTRALRFTATLAYPLEIDPVNDPKVQAWTMLLDSHMSTFAWAPE